VPDDIRLPVSLRRFNAACYSLFTCNLRYLCDDPQLDCWLKNRCQNQVYEKRLTGITADKGTLPSRH